ncbi:MAG: hypothetical protein JST54_24490 [Deltaproteobacteria bacterium]|nr:hypothetical protein [Deltaproteobacteria bacterium]
MTTPSPPPEKKKSGPWYLAIFALLGALFGHFYIQRVLDHRDDPEPDPSTTVAAALNLPKPQPVDAGPAEPPDAGTAEAVAPTSTDGGKPNLAQGFCVPEDQEPPFSRPSLMSYLLDHTPLDERPPLFDAQVDLGLGHRTFADGGAAPPGSPEHARPYIEQQLQAHPDHASAWVLRFELARATGDLRGAIDAIHKAESLDPQAAAFPLAEAELLRISGDPAGASRALQAYSTLQPGDARMQRRAALLGVEADIEADYRSANIGGLVVRASPEFAKANDLERIVEIVRDEREEAGRFTGFTPSDPLSVVILPSRTELMAVSCVNEWAGGYYDGTIKLVEGPKHALPRVDLRHELVHAVALSRLPSDKPLWFTEGVADYFSTPKKLHGQKEKLMAMNHTLIPIDSLVGTLQIMNSADAELAYAESDVLVALMIDERGPDVVPEALHKLEDRTDPTKLAEATLGHPISSEAFFQLLEKRIGPSTMAR